MFGHMHDFCFNLPLIELLYYINYQKSCKEETAAGWGKSQGVPPLSETFVWYNERNTQYNYI